ncbi:MAG: hypothetical protein QXG98_03870 [Candidatus Micrarchaeia archaeon]
MRSEIPKPSAILSTKIVYAPLRSFYSSRIVRRLLTTRVGQRVLGRGEELIEFYGLLRQLKYGEAWTARGAAHALAIHHRGFRSFRPLVETLTDVSRPALVRADAALALAKLCGNAPEHIASAGEASLIEALKRESDGDVRISALKGLGEFKSEGAARALLLALKRGWRESLYAAEALGRMALALREKPNEEDKKTLRLLEDEAHPALLEVLSSHENVFARTHAANALINIGKRLRENEEKRLIEVFEKEGNARVRDAVVDVMAALGGRASLEVLERYATVDKHVEWAVQAIRARME